MGLIRIHSLVLRLIGNWNRVWSILEEDRKCADIRWDVILRFEQKRKLVFFNIRELSRASSIGMFMSTLYTSSIWSIYTYI